MSRPVTADVDVTTTLDVPDLVRRMDGVTLKTLQTWRRKLLEDARKNWRGWVYKGRPVSKRNISLNAWEATVQSTEHPYSLSIENHARSVYGGKDYVSYIHRAGSTTLAADDLFKTWGQTMIPQIEKELTAAILAEINKPGPVKRRRLNRASTTTRLVL